MREYQICVRCIMDTTDPDITFDEQGVCNHCKRAEVALKGEPFCLPEAEKKRRVRLIVEKIKNGGQGKPYDCIIGLSGGVDSSYLAMIVKELGLRPLAVHLDNGWNSELAVQNIENIVTKLGIDLYTYVIDWEEFKDLQLSFLRASTPDSEIPSDHAIVAVLYKMARQHGVKYIIGGTNTVTESIMPSAWSQGHQDWKYIKSVQKIFGSKKLKTFPKRSLIRTILDRLIIRIEWIDLLNYLNYDKEKAKKEISAKLEWRDYGRKHGESTYTRIFQELLLPEKFGFDKRKAHFSSLIIAGLLSRNKALEMMQESMYESGQKRKEDLLYLATKMNITLNDIEEILKTHPKTMHDFPNYSDNLIYKVALTFYRRHRK